MPPFQSWLLQTPTVLHQTADDWEFLAGDYNGDSAIDIIGIKKSGTESDSTEVHVLDGATNYQSWLLQTPTALHQTADDWEFLAEDYNGDSAIDIIGIKKSGTAGSTEVHVLDGATNYQSWLLQTPTALHQTADDWEFLAEDYNGDSAIDIIGIKKSGTAGSTEVHVLDGATNYQSWLLQTPTALHQTADDWEFLAEDYNGDSAIDIIGIKKSGTADSTEVHVLDGLAPDEVPDVLWGVDSVETITQAFLDEISTTYGKPDFFGRYLGGDYGMTADEVAIAHNNDIQILVVDQSFGPTSTDLLGYDYGKDAAENAINNAQALGIPDGVAIFANVEYNSIIDSGWIEGWFDTLTASIYVPGYYANPVYNNPDNPDLDFESAYCEAVSLNSQLGTDAIIWTNQDSLGVSSKAEAPAWAPIGPACNPSAPVLAWQYGLADGSSPNVDTNLALSTLPLWG
jgi:hypothetical protein